MTMVDTLQRSGIDTPAGAVVRETGRRRALPNSRAIAGALLITLSVFGVYWAWAAASRPPTTMYVVAASDLVVGDRIAPTDLRLMAMELPDALRTKAFTSVDELDGAVVVGPVRAGELLQTGVVVRSLAEAGQQEMSFAIEPSRALAGRLRPGQRVDVLATFGVGADTYTTVVVRNALVLRIERDEATFGGAGGLTLTLGLAGDADALALAHAMNAGEVFLATSAGVDGAGPTTYQAPQAGGGGEER